MLGGGGSDYFLVQVELVSEDKRESGGDERVCYPEMLASYHVFG